MDTPLGLEVMRSILLGITIGLVIGGSILGALRELTR